MVLPTVEIPYNRLLLIAACMLGMITPVSATSANESIQCQFTPILSCSNANHRLWSDARFIESSNISTDETQLFISQGQYSYSFDIHNGELIWRLNTGTDAGYFYPTLTKQAVYLARTDGTLEKRDKLSGKLIWSTKTKGGWIYPPVVLQDSAFTAGQEHTLWKINRESGHIQQSVALKQELVTPLIAIDHSLIVSTFDAALTAYQAETLEPIWQTQLDAAVFSLENQNKTIIASDMGGSVHAISADTGNNIWTNTLYPNARFWTAIQGRTLFTINHLGVLNTINIDGGEHLSNLMLGQSITQAPIAQQDSISLFNSSGLIRQIKLSELNLPKTPHS